MGSLVFACLCLSVLWGKKQGGREGIGRFRWLFEFVRVSAYLLWVNDSLLPSFSSPKLGSTCNSTPHSLRSIFVLCPWSMSIIITL